MVTEEEYEASEQEAELKRMLASLVCFKCGKKPSELQEYIDAAADDAPDDDGKPMTPEYYVYVEEGTLNLANGHFACTDCYISIGMPSSPTGWKAP